MNLIVSLCFVGFVSCIEHDYKGFDDTILFSINWPGSPENLENLVEGNTRNSQLQKKEVLKVTTTNKEQYECHIPELQPKQSSSPEEHVGALPLNLLKPLFGQKICSFRLESYWSYEVCHGSHIRQYHEERDGKQLKTQQYYLGHWNTQRQKKLEEEMIAAMEKKEPFKTTKVEGITLPYVEMLFEEGTICDLNGKPRATRVLYVCYAHGKHEVYSFKETSTCEYEIVILSPLLCEHPQFKPNQVTENVIDCFSIGDAPKKPRNLLKMEVDSLRFHHHSIRLTNNDGETHLKFELHPLSEDNVVEEAKITQLAPTISDDSPVRAFLNGENCLNGGTGWWKYEFCYGKHVTQYHVDRAGEKTSLLLGKFDEDEHLKWIAENKGKAPKPVEYRTSVSHLYSGGDVCDKTGQPRRTEVKLKCLENSSSPAQVSLYLLEPRTCHYILGVESPLICDILPLADENGLIKSSKPILVKQDSIDDDREDATDEPKANDVPKIGND
ncbi:endoplasmic reticulum lectin 1 isoform X2 [Amyelois transitella]|uniref:endoplasmic reticulum lectin 1 isoform X2 n=1 Tax=Amyelois transitella TaxID=680683 RepID=UPI00067AF662|nr:endoplasmic reticulum lectin 1 isoform X2 [Amyelois transitella]